jgi:hypothetical protein
LNSHGCGQSGPGGYNYTNMDLGGLIIQKPV